MPAVDKPSGSLTVADLCEYVRDSYLLDGRDASIRWLNEVIRRVTQAVGQAKVSEISEAWLERYKITRKRQLTLRGTPVKNATINRELSLLHRGLVLARKLGKIASVPVITKLQEHNTRRGFFEVPQFEALLKALPADIRPLMTAAYITGWRTASELLTREWRHVDFRRNVLRLDPGETKERDGREFPLVLGLRELLETQLERKKLLEKEHNIVIPWVFFRYGPKQVGARIKNYRKCWQKAVEETGIDRIVHDLRRTAVRRLEQAGIPRTAAMKMVGHKTESIYRRYAIVDEKMIQAAGQQLDDFFKAEQAKFASISS
jgi:integrase